jgi:DNA-binding NarL/FixJ family response regulator
MEMILKQKTIKTTYKASKDRVLDELSYLLSRCWDLPVLQTSKMALLPQILKQAKGERQGLEMAKALRKELVGCAEQISQRPKFSIEDIIAAIERDRLNPENCEVEKIQKIIGVPFSRNKLDLARYYTIRLVMQGIDQQTIAEFLNVDLRTIANYVSQAKERIRIALETRLFQE